MRRLCPSSLLRFAVVLSTLPGCATVVTEPAAPIYSAETFFETTTVFGASFSHDESRVLMTSDASGVFNVYGQPVAGGPSTALTAAQDSRFAVSYFPQDDRFLFSADEGGNELNHLYVQAPDGQPRDLTPGEKVKAAFAGWRRDDEAFFVVTNERDPRYFDLYEYQAEGYGRQLVFENRVGWGIEGVSPDGRWVLLQEVVDNDESHLHLLDRRDPDAELRRITEGSASHALLSFAPDSQRVYYQTDAHGEFDQAWAYDIGTGEHEAVIQADWDVQFLRFSRNGRYRASGINQDGTTALTILDLESGQPVSLESLPGGDFGAPTFSRGERWTALYLDEDTSPNNLFVLNLETGESRQLTRTLSPAIDAAALVDAEVIRYPSFDGLEIPAFLLRPHGASPEDPVPAVIWVHGGPGGQYRTGYRADIQHLVNHGYAVLAVNNRGSSGYGKTFYHADDRKHGEVDLQDCVWGKKYLEQLGWVDGSRVAIMGGSYGGYMVVAALAFEPEVFDVGIDIFGVTNWVRTLKSVPAWWEAGRRGLYGELGDPEKEEERLRRISPLFHASNIRKPLLVVQGANDPRVLQVESDEIVQAVRANGVPVEYIVFPDEGHGFRKKANRIEASEKYVQFLDRHLKGMTVPATE